MPPSVINQSPLPWTEIASCHGCFEGITFLLLPQSVAELQGVVAAKQQLSLEAFRVRNAGVYDAIKDHWHAVAKQQQMDGSGGGRKVSGSSRSYSRNLEVQHSTTPYSPHITCMLYNGHLGAKHWSLLLGSVLGE